MHSSAAEYTKYDFAGSLLWLLTKSSYSVTLYQIHSISQSRLFILSDGCPSKYYSQLSRKELYCISTCGLLVFKPAQITRLLENDFKLPSVRFLNTTGCYSRSAVDSGSVQERA